MYLGLGHMLESKGRHCELLDRIIALPARGKEEGTGESSHRRYGSRSDSPRQHLSAVAPAFLLPCVPRAQQ